MTDQEKRLQRAQLQVEVEEAELELAHLREKAIRLVGSLRTIADKIEMNANLRPSADDFLMEVELERRLAPENQQTMDYAAAVSVIFQLRKARQDLLNLRERKSNLVQPRF